jgi:2-iminobutanoate/2-iminopropanoate deaminase
VKTVIYTTDLKQFGSLNTAYAGFMGDHRPVRTTVEVSSLPKGALVEIELTCWKEN